jgi:hypothetical protein
MFGPEATFSMAHSVDEQLQLLFDSLAERIQTEIRAHASQGRDQLVEALEDLKSREADLVNRTRSEAFDKGLQQARAEARAEAAVEASRATAAAATARSEAVQTTLSRLVIAARALDETSALSDTLNALVDAVRRESSRAGVFLWRQDRLRAWGSSAFTTSDGQPLTELDADASGVIAEAARSGLPRLATSPDGWPAVGGQPEGVFTAVPLVMNGEVIAVLCAQHSPAEEGTQLALTCELLARHAAQHLESLTARRLALAVAPQGVAAS